MTEARPRNILVIDSSPQNIGLIEAALPGSPNLFVARNYERAFSVPESATPDLVILNTTLKDEDGLELLSLLKTDGRFVNVPVIAVSPAATAEEERLALSLGAVEYLPIPFDSRVFAERVRIQFEVLERESQLARILDSIPAAVVLIDANTHTIERLNVAAAELIGTTQSDILGRLCYETICPAEKGQCPVTDLDEWLYMSERKVRTIDGELVDVQKTAVEVTFGSKRLLVETLYDIRELKNIQADLSNMLTEVETISDASPNGVRVLAPDGTILRVNQTLCEWQNCARNEIVGKPCGEVFEEYLLKNELLLAEAGEQKMRYEAELSFESGQKMCVVTAIPMRYPDGELLAMIEDIADVTELRLSELRTREAMLELNYVLGSTSSAIRVIDLECNMLRVNRSFSNWTGIPEQNLLSLKCYEALRCSHCHTGNCPIERIKNGETSVTFEAENTLPSGKTMFCLVSASPYFDSHGKLKGIMEDLTNITLRKKLEDKLLQNARTDELTGLYNRRGFFDVAGRDLLKAQRQKEGAALFYVDLDNLKKLNDTRGHEEGDKAIVDAAGILKAAFRKTDVISRIGGDEFVVFTVSAGENHIECLQSRLEKKKADFNSLREPGDFRVEMSVGAVSYDPDKHLTLEDLLGEADALMYGIKQKKKEAQGFSPPER